MRTKEILEYTKYKGFVVSERQLYLWDKYIFCSESTLTKEGRGKGNNKDYPAGVEKIVEEICRLQSQGIKSYDSLTWVLFLKQFPIPEHRIKELLLNAYNSISESDFQDFDIKNNNYSFPWILLKLICNFKNYSRINEFITDMSDIMAGCLGTGNSLSVPSKNQPETLAIINEERHSKEIKDFCKILNQSFNTTLKLSKDVYLVRKNFSINGFVEKTILKLFFAYRMEDIFITVLSSFAKFDIPQAINNLSDNDILEIQTCLKPESFSIDDILNDNNVKHFINLSNPIFSLIVPIIYEVKHSLKLLEMWNLITADDTPIDEEPWFKNRPNNVMSRLYYSLRNTNEEIERSKKNE